MTTERRGWSTAKAQRVTGGERRHLSWRQSFVEELA